MQTARQQLKLAQRVRRSRIIMLKLKINSIRYKGNGSVAMLFLVLVIIYQNKALTLHKFTSIFYTTKT